MSTYLTVEEAIEIVLLGNNDILQRDKGRMLKWAKYVFDDMKLNVLKQPSRQFFQINKRTNSIDLPCEKTGISSINVVRNGVIYPVWKNEALLGDIVDVAAAKDCSCEHNCGYKLCNTIKNYEATTEDISDFMPNGDEVTFTCVTRKTVNSSGLLVEQKQYPQRVYESGVWVDTILYTENITMCSVEVDDNGCVCDTEENINNVCGSCCGNDSVIPFGGTADIPPCEGVDTWKYYCNSKLDWFGIQCGIESPCINPFNLIYNITETGNRIIFPANFGFDKVLIRFYQTQPTGTITIPLIALDAFAMGLKWWNVRFDDKKQNLAIKYEQDYTRMKWGLFSILNKRRIAEWRMILTPPVYMASYIRTRNTTYWY